MCRLAPPADAAFYAQFSHRPEDGAGAAAAQLAAPRLLWQLAQPRAAGSTLSDLISSRPGMSTAAADGAAPAQPAKLRPGGSGNRGNRGTERPDMQQYPRAAAAHTVKGFTRLVWQSGDLAAQLTLAPMRVQARAMSDVQHGCRTHSNSQPEVHVELGVACLNWEVFNALIQAIKVDPDNTQGTHQKSLKICLENSH